MAVDPIAAQAHHLFEPTLLKTLNPPPVPAALLAHMMLTYLLALQLDQVLLNLWTVQHLEIVCPVQLPMQKITYMAHQKTFLLRMQKTCNDQVCGQAPYLPTPNTFWKDFSASFDTQRPCSRQWNTTKYNWSPNNRSHHPSFAPSSENPLRPSYKTHLCVCIMHLL